MKHTVLVTGSSRGIGAAIARAFAREGHRVVLHYHKNESAARTLLEELRSEGCSVALVQGDVSSEAEAGEIVRQAERAFGFVDVLVNNAGIALPNQLVTDTSAADWSRVFGVNMDGMFFVTRAVLPGMVSNQRGSIVNISSMWGVTGGSCEVAYSASKAAVIGFTKSLAKEVAPSGIRVNCVAPGFVSTEMTAGLDAETVEAIREETPLLKLGTPEDIAAVVLFLRWKALRSSRGRRSAWSAGAVFSEFLLRRIL